MTVSTQHKNYNIYHFHEATVILNKGTGEIIERFVASKYVISKSLCICGNIFLPNCDDGGSQNEV